MKNRFSDEQIISILREAEARVSAWELCRKQLFQTPLFTPRARSLAAWNSSK